MINVTFYRFAKRKNSTKRPTNGTAFNCNLKESCGVLNPVIELVTDNPRRFNYCYIAAFDRYYFISEWTSDHGLWYANCNVDVLASWRDSIRASRQYVLRSGSTYNTYIADPIYPGFDKVTSTVDEFTAQSGKQIFDTSNFSYIIGVINGIAGTPRIGGVTYYRLSYSEVVSLMNALLGDASYLGDNGTFPTLYGITKEVMQGLVNPMQYISESYLLPYDPDDYSLTQTSNFKVGWWTLPGFSQSVNVIKETAARGRMKIKEFDYSLPHHPQFTRGAYMDGSPFTQRTLFAQAFGDIPLDCNKLVHDTSVTITVWGDIYGDCELIITGKQSGNVIVKRQANVASPFKLSQMYQDRIGMAKNTISQVTSGAGMAAGLLSDNAITGGISGAGGYANAVLDSFGSSMPLMLSNGNHGSLYGINANWIMDNEFTHVVDDDYSQRGRPLCEDKVLNELTGFCMVADPDIEFTCYDSEYDQISSFMQGGFFLE